MTRCFAIPYEHSTLYLLYCWCAVFLSPLCAHMYMGTWDRWALSSTSTPAASPWTYRIQSWRRSSRFEGNNIFWIFTTLQRCSLLLMAFQSVLRYAGGLTSVFFSLCTHIEAPTPTLHDSFRWSFLFVHIQGSLVRSSSKTWRRKERWRLPPSH